MPKSSNSKKSPPKTGYYKKSYAAKTSYPEDAPLEPDIFEEFKQTRPFHDTSFQKLVEIAAHRFGMGKQLSSIRLCHEARKIITGLFPNNKDQIKVVSIKNGILQISASNSTWSHQLTMKKHQLLSSLQEQFGVENIKKINLGVRAE